MLIERHRWIRNGIAISVESIKLLCRNPNLLVYVIIPLLTISIWYLSMGPDFLLTLKSNYATDELAMYKALALISIVFVSIFFGCCLAHHTIHILRQQPAHIHDSLMWVLHHFIKQILLWAILLSIISFNFEWLKGEISFISTSYDLTLFLLKWGAYLLGAIALFVTRLINSMIIPIISTEKISLLRVIKRAWLLIVNNLETLIAIEIALYGIPILLIVSSFGIDSPYIQVIRVVGFPLSIIANTIFYYEFYVKRALHVSTTQLQ